MKPAIAPLFASVALAGILCAPSAFAAYRCDNPAGIADRRACAYAAQGPDALRRFIERTRAVYGLYYWDYVRPMSNGRAADGVPAERVAKR